METIRGLELRLRGIANVSRVDGPAQLMLVFAAWLAVVVVVPAIVGRGAVFPWPGALMLVVAGALLVALDVRVGRVKRLLVDGSRTVAEVRKRRVAGALTYVTLDLPQQRGITVACVTRNVDLDSLDPGQKVHVAYGFENPRRVVLVDLYEDVERQPLAGLT